MELDQDLPELLTAAEVASSTLRDLIGDLRKSSLGRGGLAPALDRFVRGLATRFPGEVHLELQVAQADPDVELVVYQVAKEAVTNAVTHSQARSLWVQLGQDTAGLRLSIRDDGVGFDPAHLDENHFGLSIMRERANAIGARLLIDTWPQEGCSVTLVVESASRVAGG